MLDTNNQPIKIVDPSNYDKVFTVGDIHGDLYELIVGLSLVDFDFNTDLLVCVGDLIDRGDDSWGVPIPGSRALVHKCQR